MDKGKVKSNFIIAIVLVIVSLANAAGLTPAITKFNGGEVTPLLLRRVDFVKYNNSLKKLENMVVLSQGPVTRRPGTKYIATVKDSSDITALIPFEFSKKDAYMLTFGDEYFRVFRNGGQVLDGAVPVEIVTVFDSSEVFDIQFVQSADVMWLVHPNHPPQILSRTSDTNWTIADEGIFTGPFLDENTSDTTITPSATTGTISLVSTDPIWDSNHVGVLWRLTHIVDNSAISGSFTGVANSASITIEKGMDYIFTTHGTWTGTVILQRSVNAGVTWRDVLTRHYENDGNLDFSRTEEAEDALYRVRMDSFTSGTLKFNLESLTQPKDGVVKITVVTDACNVTATVKRTLGNTVATEEWAEGYFGSKYGQPATVEFHEERLAYGGNDGFPQVVWLSKTTDFNNFTAGTLADAALTYSLPGQNPIQWLISQNYLFIGTLSGAGRLGGSRVDEPITFESRNYKNQAKAGSANLQAVEADDSILYVERGGRKVREFVFSIERDRYVSPDLTLLAEHITESGIVDMAFQSRPQSILWCVTADGKLLSMTYKRDEEVIAWARHITDGNVESVAVVPGGEEDEVWLIVNRIIEGSEKRYVEQLQPFNWGTDQRDVFFVDSGLSFNGGEAVTITDVTQAKPAIVTLESYPVDGDGVNLADGDQIKIVGVEGMNDLNYNIYTISNPDTTNFTIELRDSTDAVDINSTEFGKYTRAGSVQRFENTFAGLDHLEAETVTILADGGSHSDKTVASGSITLDDWYNKVTAGLGMVSKLETLPIVVAGQSGSSMAKIKRINKVTFDFYKTLGVEYGTDANSLREINFTTTETPMGGPVPLFTGLKPLTYQHGYERMSTIYLQQQRPLPWTVRAIIPEIEIYR